MAEMDGAAHPQSQQLIPYHEKAGRDGPNWDVRMPMLQARNLTVHTYNEETAQQIR